MVLLRCRHPARRARLQLALGQERMPHRQPVSRLKPSLLLKLRTCQVEWPVTCKSYVENMFWMEALAQVGASPQVDGTPGSPGVTGEKGASQGPCTAQAAAGANPEVSGPETAA